MPYGFLEMLNGLTARVSKILSALTAKKAATRDLNKTRTGSAEPQIGAKELSELVAAETTVCTFDSADSLYASTGNVLASELYKYA